jgi:L-fucose isomerase-like protein
MIGYLALARETFDVEFAESKFRQAKDLLESISSETIGFDQLITNDDIANKALDFFKSNECGKFFLFQTTFTDAKFILNFAKPINKPICIVSFPEPRTGGRLRLNSICGLNLGTHSLIKNNISPDFIIMESDAKVNKLSFSKFIASSNHNENTSWNEATISNDQIDFNYTIDKQTIGIIGTRPEGFDTCDYDQDEVTNKLNVSLINLELDDLFDEAKNVNTETIVTTKKTISGYLQGTEELVQDEFDKSISIYHGLESLKDKHNLDAFAIRCWPETFTEYGCASCGPMAMMNEKKVSCACEADVLGGISCNILNQMNNNPSLLVDIVDVDKADNSLVFWHCGLAPISMAKEGTAKSGIHSNRKKPLLHDFSLKEGKITIFRVSKARNKLQFFVMKGQVIDRPNSFSGTSGVISLGENSPHKLEQMFKGGLEHHVAFTYGDVSDKLIHFGNQMNIPTYTL